MLRLGCLPLWGREGVTLIATAENYRMTLKKRVSTEPILKKNCLARRGQNETARRLHQEWDPPGTRFTTPANPHERTMSLSLSSV